MIKCNSDRQAAYQIKTTVFQAQEKRIVRKEAMTDAAEPHLKEIYDNYTKMCSLYPEESVCPVRRDNNSLEFQYIDGTSLSELYSRAINNNDKKQFFSLLDQHVELIIGNVTNEISFHSTPEFERYFGSGELYENRKGLKCVNYEATAQNVIFEKKTKIPVFIDYEWFFSFPMPLELVLYHCVIKVSSFYVEGMHSFISETELFQHLKISISKDILEKSWLSFFRKLDEDDSGSIAKVKRENYLKPTLDIAKLAEENLRLLGIEKYNKELLKSLDSQQENVEELLRGIQAQNEYVRNLETGNQNQQLYIQALEKNIENQQTYIKCLEQSVGSQQEYIKELENKISYQEDYIKQCEDDKVKMAELKNLIERQQKHLLEQATFINRVNASLIGKILFRN